MRSQVKNKLIMARNTATLLMFFKCLAKSKFSEDILSAATWMPGFISSMITIIRTLLTSKNFCIAVSPIKSPNRVMIIARHISCRKNFSLLKSFLKPSTEYLNASINKVLEVLFLILNWFSIKLLSLVKIKCDYIKTIII